MRSIYTNLLPDEVRSEINKAANLGGADTALEHATSLLPSTDEANHGGHCQLTKQFTSLVNTAIDLGAWEALGKHRAGSKLKILARHSEPAVRGIATSTLTRLHAEWAAFHKEPRQA